MTHSGPSAHGDLTARVRDCADEAAHLLESAGDYDAVRKLRFLLATGATGPVELVRATRQLLEARLADPAPGTATLSPLHMGAPEDLRSRAAKAFQAVNGRLAREFDARLDDVRRQAEQRLAAGIGGISEALAHFDTGIAQLAYDLETRLWAEIGWLAVGLARHVDEQGLAHLAASLPAPLRRIPVTLRLLETGGPLPTAGETLVGIAQAAKLIQALQHVAGAGLDPSGVLLTGAVIATISARRRWAAQQRAARNAALAHIAEACERARVHLLDPIYRSATQAQIVLLEQAMTEMAQVSATPRLGLPDHQNAFTIRSVCDRAAALERECLTVWPDACV